MNSLNRALRKKRPYSELSWSECEKMRTRMTPNTDTSWGGELWNFVKYLSSISCRLHDIEIDAHDFYKWAKKEENSTIKFSFLPIDGYERSLSFLLKACYGITSVDGSMKLHAAFPSTPNKLWVRSTSCFCQHCFGTFFKLETAWNGWRMVDLQRKRNPSILWSTEKAIEKPGIEAAIAT